MPTQCSRDLFGYEVVEGGQVVAAFDGGDDTSEAASTVQPPAPPARCENSGLGGPELPTHRTTG
jgi:hypothetical protein